MGLQGILFYFIAALFYFILFYMCGRLYIARESSPVTINIIVYYAEAAQT